MASQHLADVKLIHGSNLTTTKGSYHYNLDQQPEEPDNCVLCLNDMITHQRVTRLRPCGHEFHKDCISQWLATQRLYVARLDDSTAVEAMMAIKLCISCRQPVDLDDLEPMSPQVEWNEARELSLLAARENADKEIQREDEILQRQQSIFDDHVEDGWRKRLAERAVSDARRREIKALVSETIFADDGPVTNNFVCDVHTDCSDDQKILIRAEPTDEMARQCTDDKWYIYFWVSPLGTIAPVVSIWCYAMWGKDWATSKAYQLPSNLAMAEGGRQLSYRHSLADLELSDGSKIILTNGAERILGSVFLPIPGQVEPKFRNIAIPTITPMIAKAPTSKDARKSLSKIISAAEAGFSSELPQLVKDSNETPTIDQLIDIYMFRYHGIDAIRTREIIYLTRHEVSSLQSSLISDECQQRSKQLRDKLVGLQMNVARKSKTVDAEEHWLISFVCFTVQTYNLQVHLDNLKVAYWTETCGSSNYTVLSYISNEHARITGAWRAQLEKERNDLVASRDGRMTGNEEQQEPETWALKAHYTDGPVSARENAIESLCARLDWLNLAHNGTLDDDELELELIETMYNGLELLHVVDLPAPKPYYHEMNDEMKRLFWEEKCGRDEIYRFYHVLESTIAIPQTLDTDDLGQLMKDTLISVCKSVWQDVIVKRLRQMQAKEQESTRPGLAAIHRTGYHQPRPEEVLNAFESVPDELEQSGVLQPGIGCVLVMQGGAGGDHKRKNIAS